ncbi:MAG: alpha/beta hydrolase-fold protein [Gemmatimonadaceae bacterium]
MNTFFKTVILAALVSSVTQTALSQTSGAVKPTRVQSSSVVGDLRIEEFVSKVFANKRNLRVLLPDGYDAPENRTRKYPVFYLADGQNIFDPATSVFEPTEWKVDETVQALVANNKIPPMIVVGVDNAGRTARAHEYLPWPDTANATRDPSYDAHPQGKRYPEFLVDEVMPYINNRYRTMRDAAHTALGGSSYGGLISVYTFAARPGVFGRALIESPTLMVFGGQAMKDVAALHELPERIFMAVGTNEDRLPNCNPTAPFRKNDEMVLGVQQMTNTLRKAGLDSTRLRVVIEPCATHTHAAWAARLPAALTFLFGEKSAR